MPVFLNIINILVVEKAKDHLLNEINIHVYISDTILAHPYCSP